MYTVYCLIFPNGKRYIGLTKDLQKRITQHSWKRLGDKNRPIFNAVRKYGNFDVEVFEQNLDLQHAEFLEKYYIRQLQTANIEHGYNLSEGGVAGSIMSEAGKKRWKQKMQQHYDDPEYTKKISERAKKRFLQNPEKYSTLAKKYIDDYFAKIENREKHSKALGGTPFVCNENGKTYISLALAAEELGTYPQNIRKVLIGERRHTKNYTFRYIKEK